MRESASSRNESFAAKSGIVQTGNGGRPGTSLNFSLTPKKTGEKAVSLSAGGQPAQNRASGRLEARLRQPHKTDTFLPCGGERTGCAGRQGQGVRQVQTIEIRPSER